MPGGALGALPVALLLATAQALLPPAYRPPLVETSADGVQLVEEPSSVIESLVPSADLPSVAESKGDTAKCDDCIRLNEDVTKCQAVCRHSVKNKQQEQKKSRVPTAFSIHYPNVIKKSNGDFIDLRKMYDTWINQKKTEDFKRPLCSKNSENCEQNTVEHVKKLLVPKNTIVLRTDGVRKENKTHSRNGRVSNITKSLDATDIQETKSNEAITSSHLDESVSRSVSARQTTVPPIAGLGHDDPRRAQKLITTDATQQNRRVMTQTSEPKVVEQVFPSSLNVFTKLARKLDSRKSFEKSFGPFIIMEKSIETPTAHHLSIQSTNGVRFITDNKLFYKKLPSSLAKCTRIDEILMEARNQCSKTCLSGSHLRNFREEAACFQGCYSQLIFNSDKCDSHERASKDAISRQNEENKPYMGMFSEMENMISSMTGKFGGMMRGAWKRISHARPTYFDPSANQNTISVVHISDLHHDKEPQIDIQIHEDTGGLGLDIEPIGFKFSMKSLSDEEPKPIKLLETVMGKKLFEKKHKYRFENNMVPFMESFFNDGLDGEKALRLDHFPSLIFRSKPVPLFSMPELQWKRKHQLDADIKEHRAIINKRVEQRSHTDTVKPLHGHSNLEEPSNKDLLSHLKAMSPTKVIVKETPQDIKLTQAQYLDLLECISRKSGMPRWLIVSALLCSALVVLWLCVSLSVSVDDSKTSKAEVGFVHLCY